MKTLTFILCLISLTAAAQQQDEQSSLDNSANKQGLYLRGWRWKKMPRPKIDGDTEKGRITFVIEVNDKGKLIRFTKESGTVSPNVEHACADAIKKLTFIKNEEAEVPKVSKGKITFVLDPE